MAVTLGGVGGRRELEGLLQSCREWKGSKVRQALVSSRAGRGGGVGGDCRAPRLENMVAC